MQVFTQSRFIFSFANNYIPQKNNSTIRFIQIVIAYDLAYSIYIIKASKIHCT